MEISVEIYVDLCAVGFGDLDLVIALLVALLCFGDPASARAATRDGRGLPVCRHRYGPAVVSPLAYVRGTGALAVGLLALAYASWHVRRRVVPGWHGATARLAEVTLGLRLLVVVLEVAGLVGALRATVMSVGV